MNVQKLIVTAALCAFLAGCEPAARKVVVHSADEIPTRLSEWGVVLADGSQFRLNDGVIPYELNTPLFSDYALKLRTVWLPDGTSAGYDETREFDFPVGTIISKTFHYEKAAGWSVTAANVIKEDRESGLDEVGRLNLDNYMLIETRLLVRYDNGWQAFPYVWNANQDEAFLEIAGDTRPIRLIGSKRSEDIVYIVPDANQCGACHASDHSSKALRPLGPRAWQLNREISYEGKVVEQLDHWSSTGLLRGAADSPVAGARWSLPGEATLEDRAKAYLDANCAHCHNPAGPADTSALQLHIDAPIDRLYGVCKTPVAVGRGSGDRPYDIYPGRPEESIMVFRMQHSDPAIAMPELGRSVVHAEGVKVISDWIASMNGEC